MSQDFFGTAYGETDGKYEGFQLGQGDVTVDDSLLLIEPSVAAEYTAGLAAASVTAEGTYASSNTDDVPPAGSTGPDPAGTPEGTTPVIAGGQELPKSFHGSVVIDATLAKSTLNKIAEEIISLLTSDPTTDVRITLEIDADFPSGAADNIRRAVSENANSLGFQVKEWE